jgi:hypothetical protein
VAEPLRENKARRQPARCLSAQVHWRQESHRSFVSLFPVGWRIDPCLQEKFLIYVLWQEDGKSRNSPCKELVGEQFIVVQGGCLHLQLPKSQRPWIIKWDLRIHRDPKHSPMHWTNAMLSPYMYYYLSHSNSLKNTTKYMVVFSHDVFFQSINNRWIFGVIKTVVTFKRNWWYWTLYTYYFA